jgi:hypothetical protein
LGDILGDTLGDTLGDFFKQTHLVTLAGVDKDASASKCKFRIETGSERFEAFNN